MISPILTPAEAATLLGIPVARVWDLCRAGTLRSFRPRGSPRGRLRICREDLEAYRRRRP